MAPLVFCLGREPLLSLAELSSYAEAEGLEARIERAAPHLALADLSPEPDPAKTIRRLGGTVRIGRWMAEVDDGSEWETVASLLAAALAAEAPQPRRKLVFGLSDFSPPSRPGADLKHLGGLVKERLDAAGIPSRYLLPIRENCLSAAQVIENQLVMKGWEFILSRSGSRCLVARTLAAQPLADEVDRDMEKPVRRLREGLLPPKIARIMVNLARSPGTRTLLDPFCGSGVILMEALTLGLEPVGGDRDPAAVEAARRNLRWIADREGLPEPDSVRLFQSKAEDLSLCLPPLSVDAAASEPYLGPPLTRPLSPDKAIALSKELRSMYGRALAEIRILLRPGARCVFVVPVFRTSAGPRGVDLARDLPLIGFREYNPLVRVQGVEQNAELWHSRPHQRVMRRILVLENRPETATL